MKPVALTTLFFAVAAAHDVNNPLKHKRQATTTTSAPPPPLATGTDIAPLSAITSGMPTKATIAVSPTFAPGSKPPLPGAPAIPKFVYNPAEWPTQDRVPPTDTMEIDAWMRELEGFNIPDYAPTKDGSCAGDASAASQAAQRGWWTCGGYTRSTDITACPDKLTWGVSFDDGPSPFTQNLLNYLKQHDIKSTFFVVGSRVISRPALLVEEYMQGHEISVHTWSHRPLTSLTTDQIVAELGWTRKAIKAVLGVTPTTMRPPFGDIDDRVRAISLAMGLVPILWTSSASGPFDTNDWRVAAGQVNGVQSFAAFNSILENATTLNTGFIVLQHDLYEISVDLAIGYTLHAAQAHSPAFNLDAIGACSKIPQANLYLETNKNASFPYANHTSGAEAFSPEGRAGPMLSLTIAGLMALAGMFLV